MGNTETIPKLRLRLPPNPDVSPGNPSFAPTTNIRVVTHDQRVLFELA